VLKKTQAQKKAPRITPKGPSPNQINKMKIFIF
jgi:hypothetical protein